MKLSNLFYSVLTMLIVTVSIVCPAFADTVATTVTAPAAATVTTTTANFGAILTYIIPILGVVLGGLGVLLGNWILKKTNLTNLVSQDTLKSTIDKIVQEGAQYAVSKVSNADWTKFETKSQILAYGINFVNQNGADLMAKAGLDSNTIQQKLEAALNAYNPTTATPVVAVAPVAVVAAPVVTTDAPKA